LAYASAVDLRWIARQLRSLPKRSSPDLRLAVIIGVVGTMIVTLASPGRRGLVAVLSLAMAVLVSLALFEFHDRVLERETSAAIEASNVRVREAERKLAEAENQHKSDLDSARARKMADYELQVEAAETARDEAVRSASQTKVWADDVVSKIRLERDEALIERDSANGKAAAALEEAGQIKRHAELLGETAREIAREAGRTPHAATPLPPPAPPIGRVPLP
jgi:hypothetical protein